MVHMSDIWYGVHTDGEILGTFHSADDFIVFIHWSFHIYQYGLLNRIKLTYQLRATQIVAIVGVSKPVAITS